MKFVRRGLLAIVILLVVASVGFFIWGSTPLGPMPEASAALASDTRVNVSAGQWLVFEPVGAKPTTGLIFYPGGRVDYRSYAPLAREIAARGSLVVIVPMPLSLAVFGAGKAADVQAAYPKIQHWAIGGHSLGGAMAANYAARHPGAVEGLILLAAYPANSDPLAASSIRVLSIYASLDGAATVDKVQASKPLLPASTQWLEIEGGNHAQFGWYGPQPGDNPALVTRFDQQNQVVQACAAFLSTLAGNS